MHIGRSLAISLALCIIFFVILRPPVPETEERGVAGEAPPVVLSSEADSADSVADSLAPAAGE